jgi:hypothetical protein
VSIVLSLVVAVLGGATAGGIAGVSLGRAAGPAGRGAFAAGDTHPAAATVAAGLSRLDNRVAELEAGLAAGQADLEAERERWRLAVMRQAAEHRRRVAALAGLELLREVTSALESVSREHRHYSDSDGRCPLGLAPDLSVRLGLRRVDMSRFLATHSGELEEECPSLSHVDSALGTVAEPPITPPVDHRRGRRDPTQLCAYHHAALGAIAVCDRTTDELRMSVYNAPADAIE